ncbi:MAG: TIM barrel protein [Clostridia bacterium]|nr:TIM barrel protein [Clostridia bacterium]
MKFAASSDWFRGDYVDVVKQVRDASFNAFERLGWRDLDLSEASAILKEYGVTNTALFFASEDEESNRLATWRHGMVFEDAKPHVIKAVRETVAAAKRLGTPNIIMITGNERCDVPREKQFENCIDTLREAAKIAEDENVVLCVEPLNRIVDHKGYFLNTSKDAFDLVRAIDSPAVRIVFDVYHQQVTEGNVTCNVTENLSLVGHVHIADNPGRNQPGTGEINYYNVLSSLKDAGYKKFVAFECGTTVPIDRLVIDMKKLIKPFED